MTIEHVLCVPTALFHQVGYFQGFEPDVEKYLSVLLNPQHTVYRPRNEVEEDPSFKQLIPYCIFRCGTEVLAYRRGKSGGEGRLHSKRSLGIGGHISSTDEISGERRYFPAMHREIDEEVFVDGKWTDQCVGLINDDETPVGKVHLGIVHIFELDSAKVRPREDSIQEAEFAPAANWLAQRAEFETWSQICLDHLFTSK